MPGDRTYNPKYILAGILLICLLAYIPVFNSGFTNHDDPGQVLQNKDVHVISLESSISIFSSFNIGTYQPVTTQIYAFIYGISGDNARAFHIFSLLVHILNVILVFILVRDFCRKDIPALITAGLFALSPMQVESVAWISSLSNLLYAFFYLAGLIAYLQYLRKHKHIYLAYTLLLFILSLLAKPAAITFPLVIFLMDIYFMRRLNSGVLLEKLPFFILSAGLLLLITAAHDEAGHIIDLSTRFGLGERILLVIYALSFYFARLFIPAGLSAFHPYPPEGLTIVYYIAPLVPLMIIFLLFRLRGEARRQSLTGLVFFIVAISVMLEIIPSGIQAVRESNVYMGSIGIYYAFASLLLFFTNGRKAGRWLPLGITVALLVFFSLFTYNRAAVWHNSISLWDDVIEKYPNASAAYINRGNTWQEKEDYNRAISDYSLAIQWQPLAADAYLKRGMAYARLRKPDKALQDFDLATDLDPSFSEAWINKGLIYANNANYRMAFTSFSEALRSDPHSARAYFWRGMAQFRMGLGEEACRDIRTAVKYGWPASQIPKNICP